MNLVNLSFTFVSLLVAIIVDSIHLTATAQELLRNKGICSNAWKEWEESSRTLPKIGGSKEFEPNGSWLEKKQIEKGLNSREFLLGIERVERSSQLASAEWLPEQKHARVTKKVGNDWANFGHEINSSLYLIPEEALILLETECLELVWEGIPLSIQQAYELLIESKGSDCTLDEYRVYSQLTRLGYRLQRFNYEKSQEGRSSSLSEPVHRKKVIVDPENGLWMAGTSAESTKSSGSKRKLEIEKDVEEIVEKMVITINGKSENTKIPNDVESEDSSTDKCVERKTKNPRVEIISDQTILSPIKIVTDKLSTSELNVPKWPGARIQRNVKLLPKRNDKSVTSVTAAESPSAPAASSKSEIERTLDKRKTAETTADAPETKKSKHEVIELSDDEAEEVPIPMSRMEMLNCLPNIANQIFITENIPRRYIPHGVRAKSTYRYDTRKLRRMEERDRPLRGNVRRTPNGSSGENNTNMSSNNSNAIVPYSQQQSRLSGAVVNSGCNYSENSMRPFQQNYHEFSRYSIFMNAPLGGFFMQQFGGMSRGGWLNAQNRWSHYMNFGRSPAMLAHSMRNFFTQNNFGQNFIHNQFSSNQQFQNRAHRYSADRSRLGSRSGQSRDASSSRTSRSPSRNSPEEHCEDFYKTSFVKLPGTLSWADLKQKWRDAKTITLVDDENGRHDEGPNEIEIVDQTIKPLINPKNYRNLNEVYERLRIIKPAAEKMVRRRKSDLKISYNVYSSTQHYRKSNPGLPMFHLVVTSRKENVFLQPVELNRLQQNGKGAPIIFAHVSNSSIAYIQSGIITLPNLL